MLLSVLLLSPYLLKDFKKFKDKKLYDGVYGLQLPVDHDRLNETMCELKELEAISPADDRKVEVTIALCYFPLS